jgi:hypothetical protein
LPITRHNPTNNRPYVNSLHSIPANISLILSNVLTPNSDTTLRSSSANQLFSSWSHVPQCPISNIHTNTFPCGAHPANKPEHCSAVTSWLLIEMENPDVGSHVRMAVLKKINEASTYAFCR